jgi:hypothetical protein
MRKLELVLFFAIGCSAPPPPEAKPGCNPIVGDDCLTPFPSSFHEAVDATTATGVRVALGPDALPVSVMSLPFKPDRLNQKDGFSPATPFLVYFKAGVDASQLPRLDDLAPSMTPQSTVQVIDFATGERVPAFAELDANAVVGDRQALIIRPGRRLSPGTRYVIALVGLRDGAGRPLLPSPFHALRDRAPLSRSLEPLRARYEEIFTALAKAGVHRGALSLAWDVVTASDETATGHLVAMRDTALSMAPSLGYTIKNVNEANSDHLLRQIDATIQVPSFLADDSGKSTMNFGADGRPAVRAVVDVPIVINVPQCAKTANAPLRTVVFGHGLFGNAKDTLGSSTLQRAGDEFCAIYAATDWIGLATSDVANIGEILASDLNGVYVVTDRLQQAHVNAQLMTRQLITKIKDDAALAVNGRPVTDGKEVYYFGVSNGGIQGGTFMGLQQDITRGVLNVPGCEWSLLIFRSTDFNALKPLLASAFPDPLDQQVGIASMQSEWDYSDPATFAPHLLANPLPGTPAKKILVQESLGDAEVANVATRVLARTMGLTALNPIQPVYGIDAKAAPLDSAYTQWDSHPSTLPPATDTALPKDNGAHDAIYGTAEAQQQIRAFLQPSGVVTDVCGGPCNITK